MEQAPALTDIPFEYCAADLNASLKVAMKVYDCTSGPPTLVATIPMTHIINGSYVGKFTPAANKDYLVSKMVYTALDYMTPLDGYSPGSETFTTKPGQAAPPDLSAILAELAKIEGAGFSTTDESLVKLKEELDEIKSNTQAALASGVGF